MLKFYIALIVGILVFNADAQYPAGAGKSGVGRANINIGRFYGKIQDAKGKGMGGVTVQLMVTKFDTVTHAMKQVIAKTDITENNGDFDLDALSLFGRYTLKITSIGFKKIENPVSFGIKMPQPGANPDFQQIASMAEKDLGNIKMEVDATELAEVTVTSAPKQVLEMGIDKKVFNVDKNLSSTGQTATEVMKSIPSVAVDIDGNVTLRNATPTIFVDGRPTTLTLDQIPADIIDKIEIVTNPSAKYDASGGNAGILNIVLKKNRKNGYNGNVRLGMDSRGKPNFGSDINYRQNKINFTGSANYMERKSISNNVTTTNYNDSKTTSVYANTDQINNGHFQFYRGGLDYFVDNRNTVSISGNYTEGRFRNNTNQQFDTTQASIVTANTKRNTISDFRFENLGAQLSYKHNFAKNGHDITADFNYNSVSNNSSSGIESNTFFDNKTKYPVYLQKSNGSGYNHFFTMQSDYENQLTDDSKFEAGVRGAVREFRSDNSQFIKTVSNSDYLPSYAASSHYMFNDYVYAAYSTYSFKVNKLGFQLGLRAESSNYTGKLLTEEGKDSTPAKVSYPLSLFPSAFVTYKLDDKQDLQLNYSRRINRPNFFQILPSYDFSDPQNPSTGNPSLKPEFTNSLEFSYNNSYKRNANFLATAYFKYSTDLITRYVYKDVNKNTQTGTVASDSLYYTSYINANNSYTYGLELTNKFAVTKWWDLLVNLNFYESKINATIPNQSVSNNIVSYFAKTNSTFKLMKGLILQITSESRSKTLIPQNNGGSSRGGGMFPGGTQTLAQGYILPRYYDIDVSLRKDWTWKKGSSGSLTLSVNDIFNSKNRTFTDASYFTQETTRYRDPQVARLNFSYRFGKFDVSLFKRKSTKADQSGAMEGMSN